MTRYCKVLSYLAKRVMLVAACVALSNVAVAEELDRVYEAQVSVVPTTLVNGSLPVEPVVLKVNMGPHLRRQQLKKTVSQGQGEYKLDKYQLILKLKPDSEGSFDNGTLSYSIAANVGRVTKSHTVTMLPRVRGVVSLHAGQATLTLPESRYFAGTLEFHAVAAGY